MINLLNEEKTIIMTKLAIYERSAGKEEIPLSTFYKRDYLKLNRLKTIIAVTLGVFCVAGGAVSLNLEYILDHLNDFNYKIIIIYAVIAMVAILILYVSISNVIYGRRYEKTRAGTDQYNLNLKKLNSIYQGENDERPKMARKKEEPLKNDEFIDF